MGHHHQVEDFLPLPASVMHIVVALADGEKRGTAILRDVTELSGGAVRMGSGTLYRIAQAHGRPSLMETEERPDPAVDDQRRRCRLTELGRGWSGRASATAGARRRSPAAAARSEAWRGLVSPPRCVCTGCCWCCTRPSSGAAGDEMIQLVIDRHRQRAALDVVGTAARDHRRGSNRATNEMGVSNEPNRRRHRRGDPGGRRRRRRRCLSSPRARHHRGLVGLGSSRPVRSPQRSQHVAGWAGSPAAWLRSSSP